jgi:hypothetical protein
MIERFKGVLGKLFRAFFLLLFFCLRIMFSNFYARKGLIQRISREGNPDRRQGVSYLTTCTKLAGANSASRLRRCLVLEVV